MHSYCITAFNPKTKTETSFKVKHELVLTNQQIIKHAVDNNPIAEYFLNLPQVLIDIIDITDSSPRAIANLIDTDLPAYFNLHRIAQIYDRYTAMRNADLCGLTQDEAYHELFAE